MKRFNLSFGVVNVFTLTLIILPITLFVLAQTNPSLDRPTLECIPVQQIKVEHNSTLGWSGLLGLLAMLSLAALNGKKYKEPVCYHKTDEENYFG